MSNEPGQPASGLSPPKAVVNRLSLYLRELQRSLRAGKETVSSKELAGFLGLTDAQVRKDFAFFGQFGYPGRGYRCGELIDAIRNILGTNRVWPVALIGCGHLGRALLGYRGFAEQGFSVVRAYDSNPDLEGKRIGGLEIRNLNNLRDELMASGIAIAILAVPVEAAQEVADRLVAAGISGILNFAPVTLSVPKGVAIAEVDLAVELEQLSFAVAKGLENQ